MFTANAKIIKSGGSEPDQFEASISNALLELEMNSDLKSHLRELYITKAKELETNNKKSIIIYVPMPKLKAFQKIQTRLVRELEKKFSGKHVMFVGERKILPKPTRKTRTKNKQKRPRSRTLTSVYDALLEDIVYPVEIVGKRIRVKLDGSQVIKVHLDKNEQTNIEHKHLAEISESSWFIFLPAPGPFDPFEIFRGRLGSITVNSAEKKSRLLRPIDHPGHGRGGSGGIEEKKREEEVNCSHLTAVAIIFLSQIRSERLPPTMVSPLGRPGKTRQQQSRAIRASIMASTSRRDGAGGSTSAGAAGNRCQAEASNPARSQNE
ncbi:RS7 protein, partial [Acromyrmex heyeri]